MANLLQCVVDDDYDTYMSESFQMENMNGWKLINRSILLSCFLIFLYFIMTTFVNLTF
jgi:hypothetical protein